MIKYSDTIELPEETTLGEADSIDQFLKEKGWTNRVGRTLGFEVEADDLWDLAMAVNEIEQELSSRGISYVADRDNVLVSGVHI